MLAELKYCILMGPTLGLRIICDDCNEMKIINWDRYNSCIPVEIFFIINLPSGRTKDARA